MFLEVKDTLTGKVTEQESCGPRVQNWACPALNLMLQPRSSMLPPFRLELVTSCLTDEKAEVWIGEVICPGSQSQQVAHPGSELMFNWLQSPYSLQASGGFPHFWLPPFLYLWLQTEASPSPNNVIKSNLLSIQLENITGYSKKCKNLQSRSKLINFYY